MLRGDDELDFRIWRQYTRSFDAGGIAVNAYTWRSNSRANCQHTRSSNRLAIMRRAIARRVPNLEPRYTSSAVSRTYVRVILLETAIILALVIFGRLFS